MYLLILIISSFQGAFKVGYIGRLLKEKIPPNCEIFLFLQHQVPATQTS